MTPPPHLASVPGAFYWMVKKPPRESQWQALLKVIVESGFWCSPKAAWTGSLAERTARSMNRLRTLTETALLCGFFAGMVGCGSHKGDLGSDHVIASKEKRPLAETVDLN